MKFHSFPLSSTVIKVNEKVFEKLFYLEHESDFLVLVGAFFLLL